METTSHRPFTGAAFIAFGAVFLLTGISFLLLGLWALTDADVREATAEDTTMLWVAVLLLGIAAASVGLSALTAGVGGLRGRWKGLRGVGHAYATLLIFTGALVIILDATLDASVLSFPDALPYGILTIAAGILLSVAAALYRTGTNGLVAGLLVACVGVIQFVVLFAFANVSILGTTEESVAASDVLDASAPVITGVGIVLYASRMRKPAVMVLALGAVVFAAGYAWDAVEGVQDGFAGFAGPALFVTAQFVDFVATIVTLLAVAAVLVAAIMAIVAATGAPGRPQGQDDGARSGADGGDAGGDEPYAAAPSRPQPAMRHLSCPRCKADVQVPPGQKPVCGRCGFGASPARPS